MKRRSKILTGFIAASITFASLFVIVGPRHLGESHGKLHNFHEKCRIDHSNMERSGQPESAEPGSLKTN